MRRGAACSSRFPALHACTRGFVWPLAQSLFRFCSRPRGIVHSNHTGSPCRANQSVFVQRTQKSRVCATYRVELANKNFVGFARSLRGYFLLVSHSAAAVSTWPEIQTISVWLLFFRDGAVGMIMGRTPGLAKQPSDCDAHRLPSGCLLSTYIHYTHSVSCANCTQNVEI